MDEFAESTDFMRGCLFTIAAAVVMPVFLTVLVCIVTLLMR